MTSPTNRTDEAEEWRHRIGHFEERTGEVCRKNCRGCETVRLVELAIASQVQRAVEAETERCAQVAEKWLYYDDPTSGTDPSRHEIAAAIRQRRTDEVKP